MATRKLPGTFRSDPVSNVNVYDFIGVGPGNSALSVRSPGATLIDLIDNSPQVGENWDLQAIAFQAYMFITVPTINVYGKFGKVIAGVVPPRDQVLTASGSGGFPQTPTLLPLPSDSSLTVTLWDPAIDPLPPVNKTFPLLSAPLSNYLPVNAQLELPQSESLDAGQQLAVGIWVLPSLMGQTTASAWSFTLAVARGTYALTYSDRRT